MTREEIIKLAREACDKDKVDAWSNGFWTITQDELERLATLVAAAEREDILRMSEAQFFKTQAEYDDAIRARGKA